MIDTEKRLAAREEKDRVRRRMHASVDPDNYEYIPAEKKRPDYYDNESPQRVAIYVRVSTDDIRQTTSYELQKKYYEDVVRNHPNWTLVDIYADEGISGTSLKHRDAFNRMISDCKAGRIDLIITKSVSRFARNILITIGTARELSHLRPPVEIFFESEHIFSLKDESQMALSFQATMAEEESHIRSRSMETSLRMRLDNGIPLTPKLLGYTHDTDGNLVINPEEAPTVKLAFSMYLYGYSTEQIAKAFIALEKKSYLGNIKWTSSAIVDILRNERHCGDVLTRKTYTEDFRTHRVLTNRGDRPQSRYLNHHEGIVSRDDFIAVQRLLDNAKYGNKSLLPELRVIESGILKGFVSINPRWAGFNETDYFNACRSVYRTIAEEAPPEASGDLHAFNIEVSKGDLDLRGFEIARSELFENPKRPFVTLSGKCIKFSTSCVRKLAPKTTAEILIHPDRKQIALRPSDASNPNAVVLSKSVDLVYRPRSIASTAFYETLFSIMGWKTGYRYKITGSLYEKGDEVAYVFDAKDAEAYFRLSDISIKATDENEVSGIRPLVSEGLRVRAIPEEWLSAFGKPFYMHERSMKALEAQSESEWKLRLRGQLFETGRKLKITPYEDLKSYIMQELSSVIIPEENDE